MPRPKICESGKYLSLGTIVLPADVIQRMQSLAVGRGGMASVVRAALIAAYGDETNAPDVPDTSIARADDF